MWLKRHDKTIKMAITGIALAVAIVIVGVEMKAQRESDALAAERDQDLERNKPFYDCIIAAEAMVSEDPAAEEAIEAGKAERECYERYGM
ncbi:MAG TPA: hypothetical protein VNM40_01580 [Candidatus Paceibacterota bacterium]|nr:hypothetical protein [Candidatus Paceibacterota bacterium]